jgi:uncharacterized protein (DUF58 family)
VIIRPGRQLVRAVTGLAIISLAAFTWGPVLWFTGVALAALSGLAWLDARRASRLLDCLEVTRRMPRVAGRDLPFTVQLTVRNNSTAEAIGEVRDVRPDDCLPVWENYPASVPAGQSVELVSTLRIPRRGLQTFGPVWIRVAGGWGLVEVQREFPCPGAVKVLPELFASREELQKDLGAQALLLDKMVRARQQGAGTEFVSLDEYRRGDDPRRIDWRSTARHRFPIVRRHQVERHRDVLIMIDSGRLMGAMTDRGSKLDCAVDAALNLARVALNSGDRCGIGVFDSTVRGFLAPIAGAKSLSSLVECAYDLQTNWQETDFTRMFAEIQRKQAKRCFLIVLSDLGDAETSRAHCAALAKLSRRHLVLFAALRTPLLRSMIQDPPKTLIEGGQQVVAHSLLRDRGRALHALRHGSIQVLDVEPRQLTLPLVNRFIEMRQRNQL